MAGIGFELKKIFRKNAVGSRLFGTACAAVIVSGPTFLAIFMLLGIERVSASRGGGDWDVLLSLITYAMLGALLTASVLSQVLARFTADRLYQEQFGRVMPSLNGGFLLLILPGGILYALLLSTASAVSVPDRILNWADYALMTFVYLQLGYLTAVKQYKPLLLWFAAGMAGTVLSAWLLVSVLGISVITGVSLALFLGYGLLMTGNSRELYKEFPFGYGSGLYFLKTLRKHPWLCVCGFFSIAVSFIHIVLMWFGRYGMQVTGAFRAAPVYDAASFYAFLVQLPSNILFVISMEVNFYSRYAAYFDAVSLNGTLSEIERAREDMLRVLKNELLKLEVLQLAALLAYIFLMRFYLPSIGFTQSLLIVFDLLCVGYAALGVGVCLILLLLYFDDTKAAALVSVISFSVCGFVTYRTLSEPKLYGLGLVCGGLCMLFLGTAALDRYLRDVDDNVFCCQPVFSVRRRSRLTELIDRLDDRMIRKNRFSEEGRAAVNTEAAAAENRNNGKAEVTEKQK